MLTSQLVERKLKYKAKKGWKQYFETVKSVASASSPDCAELASVAWLATLSNLIPHLKQSVSVQSMNKLQTFCTFKHIPPTVPTKWLTTHCTNQMASHPLYQPNG